MTDPETIKNAGKRIAATASGRAFREDLSNERKEELTTEDTKLGKTASERAMKESQTDPGNPNAVDHDGHGPRQ